MLRQSHPAQQVRVPRIVAEDVVRRRRFDKQQLVLIIGFIEPKERFLLVAQLCIGPRYGFRIIVLARRLINVRVLLQNALPSRGRIGLPQGGRNPSLVRP